MKLITYILATTFLFLACKEKGNKNIWISESIDEEENLEIARNNVMRVIHKNYKGGKYYSKFSLKSNSDSTLVDTEIEIDSLFGQNKYYLVLRRTLGWGTYLNIFRIQGTNFEELIEIEQADYISDTTFDVNGDEKKDFIVHYYPKNGCCSRDSYSIYLNINDNCLFCHGYEFINPIFIPEERLIIGKGYGYVEDVGFYKYQWNGLELDTLQYLLLDISTDKFIITDKWLIRPKKKDGIPLDSIPREFKEIVKRYW